MTNSQAVEILIQIRDDLRGIHATNAGLAQMRTSMAATSQAAQVSARSIGREFSEVGGKIRAAFSPTNLAKGVLSAAGIGGGLALVNLTISKWADIWRESARYAAEVQQRSESIAEAMQATSKAAREAFIGGLEPEKQLGFRRRDLASLDAKLAEAEGRRSKALAAAGWVTREALDSQLGVLSNFNISVKEFQGEKFGGTNGMGGRDFYELMQQRADEAQALWNKLREQRLKVAGEVKALEKEVGVPSNPDAAYSKFMTETNPAAKNAGSLVSQSNAINAEALNEQLVQMQRNSRSLVDLAKEANANTPFYFNPAEIKAAAVEQDRVTQVALKHLAVWRQLFATIEDGGVTQAIANNEKYAEQAKDAAAQMGWAFSSAFEQAILDGKKLSDVLRGLARDILQIAIRKSITEPLGGAVGNFFSSIFAAGGGTFLTNGPTQLTVGDNPGGAELVSVLPLSGVGTTRVSGSVAQMAGGGSLLAGAMGGGDTFHFNYSFGGGVSREEIAGLLPTMVEASKNAVLDAKRRGRGGFR